MNSVPFIPENAPFTDEQRAWLNGFLAGVLSRGEVPAGNQGAAVEKIPLLILFGSQSGNAESLAKRLAKDAKGRGFEARAVGLDSVKPLELAQEKNVLLITSTWGEGDMPDNAMAFWDGLNQNGSSPSYKGLQYSVLALGDMNYAETFCLAGRKLDERMEQLGAARVYPRVDCDVDFDEPAQRWSEAVFEALTVGGAQKESVLAVSDVAETAPVEVESGYSKKNPFPAPLVINRRLNGEGSAKDTRHIGFSLTGSGLVYETGDALGVRVQNCPEVVRQVISAHQLDETALVPVAGGEAPLFEALTKHYEVRTLLGKTPEGVVSAAEFADRLRKLNPRLYSIASSQKANPDEVHLCIGAVRYEQNGIAHKGVASTFLADRCAEGQTTGVFVHTAKHFRVPADGGTPIIMVGPGTGIAPFRAFLQERQVTGASGRNWLLFGDQCRATDYLYEDEIEAWKNDGLLTRLDLAFSRDQEAKIYVQHRMLENGAEMWKWLDEGAHFYVCGDASRMAKDVDAALHTIIQEHGGKSMEQAAEYVAEMKKLKRYGRDVY